MRNSQKISNFYHTQQNSTSQGKGKKKPKFYINVIPKNFNSKI